MTYQLDAHRYRGLGGWLVLVGIGLVVTPLKIGVLLFTTFLPAFGEENWTALTTPGSEAYHPLWGPLLIAEFAINTLFILGGLGLLFLFFTKSRWFPKAIIAYFLANLLYVTADYFAVELIPSAAAEKDGESAWELARTLVVCAIWVPYFLVSKRVKLTFIEPQAPVAPPPLAPA